jgi:hypothetical protein
MFFLVERILVQQNSFLHSLQYIGSNFELAIRTVNLSYYLQEAFEKCLLNFFFAHHFKQKVYFGQF